MLAIKGLNQFYGGSHTLWDVDLDVPAGSRMCLMGRNGMGKTTLLRCVMGLQEVKSGGIAFDGTDLLKCPASQRAKLGIGYVPQGRDIFPQLTVEENLRMDRRKYRAASSICSRFSTACLTVVAAICPAANSNS
jgi:urea transport system ATP-binding protein